MVKISDQANQVECTSQKTYILLLKKLTQETPFFNRSAPEVILDGYYSHASDVWAFGILGWELYASYQYGQEQQFSIPYHWLDDDKVKIIIAESCLRLSFYLAHPSSTSIS